MIRQIITGGMMLLASLATIGQTTMVDNPLIRARYQLSEKLYADAIATIENRQFPGDQQAIASLVAGSALSGLERYAESNELLSQVTGDGAADAYYCMAKNYVALNDFPAAVQYLEKHLGDKNHYSEKDIRMDPAFEKLEDTRDWVHLWQKEWYTESEKVAAECRYLISLNQLDEADEALDKLLIAFPEEPEAWFLKAKVFSLRKEDRQSRQALDKAWQYDAGSLPLKVEMLHFAMETGYDDKANVMASELIRRDPTNPEYLIERALVRIIDGKESQALKEIEATEKAGIAPAELYYQAGLKISSTNPVQAESYLDRAIETGKLDARYYCARALARMTNEKWDQALADFAMSLDINPTQPDLYFRRAQLRLDLGDSDGACHDWQKALEMGIAKAADLIYKNCRLP